jgi:cell pole-organizing protein PopZ
MRQDGEPTVEEILESIKKVIARDNRTGAAEERRVRETRGVVDPVPQQSAREQMEILDLAEFGEGEDLPSDSLVDSRDDPADAAQPDVPLLDARVQSSVSESLAALAAISGPRAQPQIVRSGETSLEGMVRDLLRPALAHWLDANLPPMVERLVAAEIARIVGKRV